MLIDFLDFILKLINFKLQKKHLNNIWPMKFAWVHKISECKNTGSFITKENINKSKRKEYKYRSLQFFSSTEKEKIHVMQQR